MDVRFDDPLNLQSVLSGFGQIDVYVTARIHDHSAAGALIPDQIRPLGEAVQVVLREDHRFRLPTLVTLALHKFPGRGSYQQFAINVSSKHACSGKMAIAPTG